MCFTVEQLIFLFKVIPIHARFTSIHPYIPAVYLHYFHRSAGGGDRLGHRWPLPGRAAGEVGTRGGGAGAVPWVTGVEGGARGAPQVMFVAFIKPSN